MIVYVIEIFYGGEDWELVHAYSRESDAQDYCDRQNQKRIEQKGSPKFPIYSYSKLEVLS